MGSANGLAAAPPTAAHEDRTRPAQVDEAMADKPAGPAANARINCIILDNMINHFFLQGCKQRSVAHNYAPHTCCSGAHTSHKN